MKAFTGYAFTVLALTAAAAVKAPARITVRAQVDTSKDIYLGERFDYNILIQGGNTPGDVDLRPLAEYNPKSTGNRDYSQTSISIVNGRTTKNVEKRYVMGYALTARKEGRIRLPAVTVTIEGRKYRTNPVAVTVVKPGTTDRLDIEVTLSEEKCYVGQPVIMTVKLYVPQDIRDFQFNIPAFESGMFELEDPVISQAAKQFDIGTGVTVFVSQRQVTHNGRGSVLLSFSKVLIPQESGHVQLEPVTVSANLPVGRVRSRRRSFFMDDFWGPRVEYKRFMVSSKPLTLMVHPLPQEGKPEGFYGLVGRYKISASATPTTAVYMGDPITLTIKVGGTRYLKAVQWPDLEGIDQLAANFKIPSQKAAPEIQDGFKIFTQTIRPDNNHANVIPSIPLACFDPDKGKYVVAKSEPIKLELIPSKRLTTADMEGRDFSPVNKEVEAIKKGLSANYEEPDALKNMRFSPTAALVSPGYAPIWALPLAAMILSSIIKVVVSSSPEKAALKRRRQARKKAIDRLKKVSSASAQDRHEFFVSAMTQYIGERFDRVAGTLTADDCREVILDATANDQAAEQFRQLVAHCETARYTSVDATVGPAQISNAIGLIRIIEKQSKK